MTDKEKVELAASILDQDKPEWYKMIDLEKLTDLQDAQTCVLGQVYGNWGDNQTRLFDGKGLIGVTSCNQDYLGHWRELIANRQGGKPFKARRTIWNLFGLLKG
jgi:hypothetical protein